MDKSTETTKSLTKRQPLIRKFVNVQFTRSPCSVSPVRVFNLAGIFSNLLDALTSWLEYDNVLLFAVKEFSFSLIKATQILGIVNLLFLPFLPIFILEKNQTVESKFSVKSIKNRVQNLVYHQKSINS